MISANSELGWLGLLVQETTIFRIRFGFKSELKLLQSFSEYFDVQKPKPSERKWVNRFLKYAEGKPTSLADLPIDLTDFSNFQRRVLSNCQQIPYGETITYGQLAAKSNSPRAARAVGTAMKMNRCPLAIPCHRVVASGGLGGYSAGDGLTIKRKLLEMEGAQF